MNIENVLQSYLRRPLTDGARPYVKQFGWADDYWIIVAQADNVVIAINRNIFGQVWVEANK